MSPLAERLRPHTKEEFIGQAHVMGQGKPLARAMEERHLFSFILCGPPGVGKTTLARMYARACDADYYELSAVSAGKADIKAIVEDGAPLRPRILFLDEIHRFTKAQQDYLLPFVETGHLTLLGATTENPSFEVIPALLSRMRIFTLRAHTPDDLHVLLDRIAHLPEFEGCIDSSVYPLLVDVAQGDARSLIGIIEATHALYGTITKEHVSLALESRHVRHDKGGEDHFNVLSAFIKSLRRSQPDAAMYYLARLVEAGEDPLMIARRMVVFASEDIGLAQPTALVVANAVFRACETVGYPECAINLAHGVAYLAHAKKDREAYDAYHRAQADVAQYGGLPVPLFLRNAPTAFMKEEGYGRGYELYGKEDALPSELVGKKYFTKPPQC